MHADTPTHNAGGTPAIVFTGCDGAPLESPRSPLSAAAAGADGSGSVTQTATRREIKVNGKRVKTIDVHAHCVIPEALALQGKRVEDERGPGIGEVGARRIAEMDAAGIDVEALSINPHWYRAEKDLAVEICRINNERLAEYCATYPQRFVAFASVTLQSPDVAVRQLENAVKNLGFRGAAVGASCAGDEFSNPKFHPFWAKCEELGILVFIHPQSTPELSQRFKGNGWLSNTIGNPLDTTICLSHLIFDGTLDKFPKLKFCSAHGGGYLPSYAPRSDNACRVGPEMCNPEIKLKKRPTEYLRDMYFDTLVFTSEALRHLAAEVGTSRLVIGTDHPIPWHQNPVDHIMNTPGFTDDERMDMLGRTAAKLLKIE
jgi:predicted TIM-barrel fold metal-dependent hydrolase